jgi:hypothetical protein
MDVCLQALAWVHPRWPVPQPQLPPLFCFLFPCSLHWPQRHTGASGEDLHAWNWRRGHMRKRPLHVYLYFPCFQCSCCKDELS